MLKLLIAEPSGLFRDALDHLFSTSQRFEVVGHLDRLDAVSLRDAVILHSPDVILAGVAVANMATLDAITQASEDVQQVGVVVHGRALTLPAAVAVAEILRSSNSGFAYLETELIESAHDLLAVCEVVAQHRAVVDPRTAQRLLEWIAFYTHAVSRITDEEEVILAGAARGDSDSAIAAEMGVDARVVRSSLSEAALKLGVDGAEQDSRVGVVLRYLVAKGTLPLDHGSTAPLIRSGSSKSEPVHSPSSASAVGAESTDELGDGVDERVAMRGFEEMASAGDAVVAWQILGLGKRLGLQPRWGQGSFSLIEGPDEAHSGILTVWAIGTVEM